MGARQALAPDPLVQTGCPSGELRDPVGYWVSCGSPGRLLRVRLHTVRTHRTEKVKTKLCRTYA